MRSPAALLLLCCTTSADAASRARRSKLQLRVRGGRVSAAARASKRSEAARPTPSPHRSPRRRPSPTRPSPARSRRPPAPSRAPSHRHDKNRAADGPESRPGLLQNLDTRRPGSLLRRRHALRLGDGLELRGQVRSLRKTQTKRIQKAAGDHIPLARFAAAVAFFVLQRHPRARRAFEDKNPERHVSEHRCGRGYK